MRNNSGIGIKETRATRSTMHKRQSDMSGRSLCHSRNRKKSIGSLPIREIDIERGSENIFGFKCELLEILYVGCYIFLGAIAGK